MTGQAFGFVVRQRAGQWNVFLPHQCQSWDVAGEAGSTSVPHGQAVRELEQFVAEAQEALTALRAGTEFGVDEHDSDPGRDWP